MIEKWDITIPELTGDESARCIHLSARGIHLRHKTDGFRYCTCLTDTTSFFDSHATLRKIPGD